MRFKSNFLLVVPKVSLKTMKVLSSFFKMMEDENSSASQSRKRKEEKQFGKGI